MAVRYPLMPKDESREMRQAIRRVFNEVWNPIRVMGDSTWPRDEYDGYIGEVFELLVAGGSDEQFEAYFEWATGRMGMDGSRVSHKTFTDALRAIPWNDKPNSQ